jgi:hypothetical protein
MIATQGKTQNQAAEAVGMHYTSLSKALAKPEVRAWLETRKAQFSLDAEQLKHQAKALAIHTGIELMREAKSEQVRARMVEFFAGDPRQALVNIGISGPAASAYTFSKGAPPDTLSGVEPSQAIDITPQSDDA